MEKDFSPQFKMLTHVHVCVHLVQYPFHPLAIYQVSVCMCVMLVLLLHRYMAGERAGHGLLMCKHVGSHCVWSHLRCLVSMPCCIMGVRLKRLTSGLWFWRAWSQWGEQVQYSEIGFASSAIQSFFVIPCHGLLFHAGADIIISYYTPWLLRWIKGQSENQCLLWTCCRHWKCLDYCDCWWFWGVGAINCDGKPSITLRWDGEG